MEMREKRNNLFKEIKKELATQEEISAKKIRTTNNTSKQTIQSDEMKASSETTHEKLHQYKGRNLGNENQEMKMTKNKFCAF